MTVFLLTLLADTDCYTAARAEAGTGFEFAPRPGQEVRFDRLARQIMTCPGGFSIFSRQDGSGVYRGFHIIPHDGGRFAEAVARGMAPPG